MSGGWRQAIARSPRLAQNSTVESLEHAIEKAGCGVWYGLGTIPRR